MSNYEPNSENIFLSKGKNRQRSFRGYNNTTSASSCTNDDAQKWLDRFKLNMESINKQDIKTTLPQFVQDFIYKVWSTEDNELYKKPKKTQTPECNTTRWNQIKEDIFESEEQKRQENTFKMSQNNYSNNDRNNDRNNRDRCASHFRSRSYKKPKKKVIFDLEKETSTNGFPNLN